MFFFSSYADFQFFILCLPPTEMNYYKYLIVKENNISAN